MEPHREEDYVCRLLEVAGDSLQKNFWSKYSNSYSIGLITQISKTVVVSVVSSVIGIWKNGVSFSHSFIHSLFCLS
jgi:hypothetical protein